MRNFTQRFLLITSLLLLTTLFITAQKQILPPTRRCETMEELDKLIHNNPGILEQWRAEGQRQYNAYLKRQQDARGERIEAGEIIIPIVFHIVDSAQRQAWVTDRDVYEQVELLNIAYSGKKADTYKGLIPQEITDRVGRIPVKFVLARRKPDGSLSSGIERRVAASPDHVNIKATATGGLDAWDVTKYVNVWCGTFSGSELGLLGIATFPFTTGNGAQGVVIGTATLPYTSNVARSYYPTYTEGATLAHELGHYFYLWHTFGDNAACNNLDFRIQDGWPLPSGAGPEGDDTPDQKGNPSADGFVYGNPSQNYNVGCSPVTYGIVYGSFMNYFDDRALFMFTDGMRKRVESCIDLYRAALKTSNGATPPVAVTDAFMVTVNPRGTPERRVTYLNNSPLTAVVRNTGTSNLTTVTVNLQIDAAAPVATVFPLSLAPGIDTTLKLGNISFGTSGGHILTVYTSSPNGAADSFTNNDSLQSFIIVQAGAITAPFTESFTPATFPPAQWLLVNPNGGTPAIPNTWVRNSTSGFTAAGSAYFNNYNINQVGTLDELITPAINFAASDSSLLSFRVAHAVYDNVDVSTWDGLEVYVSGDGGITFTRAYKKTGIFLKTIDAAQTGSFAATPAQPERWRMESVNLTPYIVPGKNMIISFRNTNAFGNNTFIDDINVTAATLPTRDAAAVSLLNVPAVLCGGSSITPTLVFANKGKDTITSLKINYRLDNGTVTTLPWTGILARLQSAQLVLNTISNIPSGSHTLTVFTSDPNGLVDQITANDTLKINLLVLAPVQPPIKEGFEGSVFPPANWILVKSNNPYTWERTTTASSEGVAAAWMRNYAQKTNGGSKDDLYAPLVQLSAPDSVFLKFDIAHVTAKFPGSTAVQLDTLEVLLTKDCGLSFISVYKKWGEDLQTVGGPNFPAVYPPADTTGFIPGIKSQWRRDSVDLTPFLAGSTGAFQLVFRNITNNGNNTYLDNVNITPLVLPAKLKAQGYLIAPNPSNGLVTIRHYLKPTNLKGIQVINSSGQVLIQQQYNGNAISSIPLDLTRYANGIYTIRMVYDNKVIMERIVKLK
ncbi:MAG TPA: choice-of-anchor J domain-containing protein [Chitinophagaceae bacterium]|nr:choice-of-anchor J domain-containing protein [Chitinophagaceae bacterium]